MINLQAPEKRIVSPSYIDVHSIFYTIQGEGPFSGTPAVFIRLAGCNLQCPGCDTEYTQGRRPMRPVDISYEAAYCSRGKHQGLVVITGGEPFRQDIAGLIKMLVHFGFYVQVETNGTLPAPTDVEFNQRTASRSGAYIVVSPKGSHVAESTEAFACAYKYVLSAGDIAADGLPIRVLDHPCKTHVARPPDGIPVYVQPADMRDVEENKANLDACVASCIAHGYVLQLQLHKILGVP